MATRFYLPSTGASAVDPSFTASWEKTASAIRRKIVTTKISSALASLSYTGLVDTTPAFQVLKYQGVSDPLEGQTITGSVTGLIRASVNVNGGFYTALTAKIVSNDGLTVRGTLLALTVDDNDFPEGGGVGFTPRDLPGTTTAGQALTSVIAQAGDRLVLEIGVQHVANSFRTTYLAVGDVYASDVTSADLYTETSADFKNPWVEFSQTLLFQSESSDVTVTVVGVAATGAVDAQVEAVDAVVVPDGVEVDGDIGPFTVTNNPLTAVTGVAATAAIGTVVVFTSTIVPVTGVSATFALGEITPPNPDPAAFQPSGIPFRARRKRRWFI